MKNPILDAMNRKRAASANGVAPRGEPKAVAHAPKKPVRTLPPWKSFPVGALPEPLAAFVIAAAAAIGCDCAAVALPVLAAVGNCIGNTRRIWLKRTWLEPPVFWTVIVAESGSVKSPPQDIAFAHLQRVQRLLYKEFKEATAAYEEKLQAWEKAKKDDRGERPEKPVFTCVLCDDTSIESLIEILEDSPRGVVVHRDELGNWFVSFIRYGKNGASDMAAWLHMHGARPVSSARKTGERRYHYVPRAAVCVAGTIQPRILARALGTESFESGLAARLLFGMPPKAVKVWSEAEMPLATEQAYERLIDDLLRLEFDVRPENPDLRVLNADGTEVGELVPHVLKMSPLAKAAWVRFYNAWGKKQAGASGDLAAAFSKLEGYAARFALLHHVVSRVHRGESDLAPIELESVEAGVELSQWFAYETERVYAVLKESDDERDARQLVALIQSRGGSVTARDLMRSNRIKYPTADAAESAMSSWEKAGLGECTAPTTGPKGGRPVRHFKLYPPSENELPDDESEDSAVPLVTGDTTDKTSAQGDAWEGTNGDGSRDTTSRHPQ